VILAFPAIAQTSTDSNSPSTSAPDARAQSEPTGEPTCSNPATSKTGNTAIPNTKTNSPAAKAESKLGRPQPESNPGTKKAGSAVLININKAKQKMTVFLDGIQKYAGRYQRVELDIQLHQELILRPL
jgi:hypothetical protein